MHKYTIKDMITLSQLEQTKGYVHLYTGGGKGKTTAAVGLAARFLGAGGKVLFCQFLKGRPTGEIASLERLGAEVRRCKTGGKFYSQLNWEERQELGETHTALLASAAEAAASGEYGLLVLDEVVDAMGLEVVTEEGVLALLAGRSPGVEVVLTGHYPAPEIVAAADYYTEFVRRQHPYQKGVAARAGIEF
jgi:cob(I)alamin adenosyltransferase